MSAPQHSLYPAECPIVPLPVARTPYIPAPRPAPQAATRPPAWLDEVPTGRHRALRARPSRETMVLRYVQPGLVGLIDGTLSTLAPIFAAALLSGAHAALFVGLATALGAGISMGLSEALSDDGSQTGRGSAISRGAVTGVMTAVGGLFHAVPFVLPDTRLAIVVAGVVVAIELAVIAVVRKQFLSVSLGSSIVQVVLGGAVIVAVGLVLGGM